MAFTTANDKQGGYSPPDRLEAEPLQVSEILIVRNEVCCLLQVERFEYCWTLLASGLRLLTLSADHKAAVSRIHATAWPSSCPFTNVSEQRATLA